MTYFIYYLILASTFVLFGIVLEILEIIEKIKGCEPSTTDIPCTMENELPKRNPYIINVAELRREVNKNA